MKYNLENIPEVSIDKVDAFYVTGTSHRDAAGKTNNLKLNLKTLGGEGIDLTDREALRKLYSAMLDAASLVLITEDLCVYNDDPSSPDKGTYTVSMPEEPALPGSMDPTIAVSGLFKDVEGNTHRLENLELRASNDNEFMGKWQESNTEYILTLKLILNPVSGTKGRMSITSELV